MLEPNPIRREIERDAARARRTVGIAALVIAITAALATWFVMRLVGGS